MKSLNGIKLFLPIFLLPVCLMSAPAVASDNQQSNPGVTSQIFEKAKKNNDWKVAFLTAKDAQVVFMNVTPSTNPNNDVGMEKHQFDQIIFVVEGKGQAVLDGKTTMVAKGDMVFIPQGTEHNIINLDKKKSLKIMSVYSGNDMPANAAYKKKADAPQG